MVFFVFPGHGQTLTRVPNVLFGGLTTLSLAWLLYTWHGKRSALFGTALFATSAWVLHVSRLASFDVLYLWVMSMLLLIQVVLPRYSRQVYVFYGSILMLGMLLYVPGMVWLILTSVYWQRKALLDGWQYFAQPWQHLLSVLAAALWSPLLLINLLRPGNFRAWLGLPAHFTGVMHLLKGFFAVFVHLFVRGPQYSQLWLGRAALLDVFTLTGCILGIYFYVQHRQAVRSRFLASFFLIGVLLVGLGGPVSLSLLVPLLYIFATTGITYLLRDWLRVFPINPLARSLGIGLVSLAVVLACAYNIRAYFVAWPHAEATQAIFRYHR